MSKKKNLLIALLLSAGLTKVVSASPITFEIPADAEMAGRYHRALDGLVVDEGQKDRVLESIRKRAEKPTQFTGDEGLRKYSKAVAGQRLDKSALKTNGSAEDLVESAMLHLASKGDLSMMRLLGQFYEDKGMSLRALQFYTTELLMSFGESYDFPALFRLSEMPAKKSYLQAATNTGKSFKHALADAGQWLRANSQDNSGHTAVAQTSLSAAFDLLEAGQYKAFFANTDHLKARVTRVKFLQFFRHLGLEDVNPAQAFDVLSTSAQAKLNVAVDLQLVLNLLISPSDQAVESLMHHLRYREQDEHMKSIYQFMQLERANVSVLANTDQAHKALARSLKI